MDLADTDQTVAAQYAKLLADQGVTLPLRLVPDFPGQVVDDAGQEVLVVDELGDIEDAVAARIAGLVVLAVNTCGRFVVEEAAI